MINVKVVNAFLNDADISERLALRRISKAERNGYRYITRRDNTHFSATLSAHLFPRATMNLRWRHCYEIGKNERLNRYADGLRQFLKGRSRGLLQWPNTIGEFTEWRIETVARSTNTVRREGCVKRMAFVGKRANKSSHRNILVEQ